MELLIVQISLTNFTVRTVLNIIFIVELGKCVSPKTKCVMELWIVTMVQMKKDAVRIYFFPKGHLISKCLFGAFNSSKKTNENKST